MSAPHTIQDSIKAYLQAHPYVMGPPAIPVYTQDEGDLFAKFDAALGSLGVGIAILITVPEGENNNPDSARVSINQIVDLRAIEKPLINRSATGTNKSAYSVVRLLASEFRGDNHGLHGWKSAGDGCSSLKFTHIGADVDSETGEVMYFAQFKFNETF